MISVLIPIACLNFYYVVWVLSLPARVLWTNPPLCWTGWKSVWKNYMTSTWTKSRTSPYLKMPPQLLYTEAAPPMVSSSSSVKNWQREISGSITTLPVTSNSLTWKITISWMPGKNWNMKNFPDFIPQNRTVGAVWIWIKNNIVSISYTTNDTKK